MKIVDGVYWVGVADWGLRHFHGFELSTHKGSSYNSYLIKDEKIALIDTVWEPFAEEFLSKLQRVVDLESIDYVIANHGEVDHSGALPALMEKIPEATLVVSPRGEESLRYHYHQDWNFQVVKTGDRISLGRKELVFIEAPMLHWPDSMFTYLTEDNILMSNDAFGMHYASSGLFDDLVDMEEVLREAVKYYANILTPFSRQVVKKIEELKKMEVPVDIIAPSHGIIWRKDPGKIIDLYYRWGRGESQERIIIAYDTMWEATARMAYAIEEGIHEEGIDCRLLPLAVTDRNDVVAEVFQARGLLLGSPTFNRSILPTVAPFLEEVKGLRFQNKLGAAFGSYGWSGEAVSILEKNLKEAGIEVLQEGINVKFQPNQEDLEKCRTFAREFAAEMKKRT